MPVGPGGGGAADPLHPGTGVPLGHQRGRAEPAVRHRRGDRVPARLRDGRGAGGVPGAGQPDRLAAARLGARLHPRDRRHRAARPAPQRPGLVHRRRRPGRAAAVHGGPGAGLPDAAAVPDRLAALTPVAVGGLADRGRLAPVHHRADLRARAAARPPGAEPGGGGRIRGPGAGPPADGPGAGRRGRRAGLHLADRAVPPVRERGAQADRVARLRGGRGGGRHRRSTPCCS